MIKIKLTNTNSIEVYNEENSLLSFLESFEIDEARTLIEGRVVEINDEDYDTLYDLFLERNEYLPICDMRVNV
jgi:hypothetical protein|tara:strand:+ start:383 stop:601 length:219 start_codon:yes stop_codon:yes gene_type:complete